MTENNDGLSEQDIARLRIAGAMYLRDYSYDLPIYQWMKDYGVGESTYGKLMDALGRQPGIFDHRHFGHHLIYDFPLCCPENIPDFLEHLLISDLFTKQGVPTLPGEFLKFSGIQEYCSIQTLRWNFVNAFDLLSGTLAIYGGYKNIKEYWNGDVSIDSFAELAKQLGIGGTELAIALSTQNPFILLGAAMQLAGTAKGLITSPSKAYFRKVLGRYTLIVAAEEINFEKQWDRFELSVGNSWADCSVSNTWSSCQLE